MKNLIWFAMAASVAAVSGPVQVYADTLTMHVGNIRGANGVLYVSVCDEKTFLKDGCPYKTHVPAKQGATTAVIKDIPAGTYAVQAFFDENDSGKLDRNFLGVPQEGVGFSKDPNYTFSAPTFADCSFKVEGDTTIKFSLRYF